MCLSLVVLCLWFSSAWVSLRIDINNFGRNSQLWHSLSITEGRLVFSRVNDIMGMSGQIFPHGVTLELVHKGPRWKFGFDHTVIPPTPLMTGWNFRFPLWALFIICVIPTLLFWRNRTRSGYCSCSYSRAGLADSSPCPECGRRIL